MDLAAPLSPSFHRSQSDRDLITTERRLSRARLSSSSSTSNLALPSPVNTSIAPLPWDRLQQWLYGIAVVTFDLELGQSIELLLPNHCKLTEKEKSNLSYLAFPDTNSTSLGDFQYHFRIHHELSNLSSFYQYYNSIVPPALQVDQNSLFGYVNFRQIRDKNIKRGFFQKSFVILSKLPFISLFTTLVHQLAINYFQHGLSSFESCCRLMDHQWPEPEPGRTLFLPLLDNVFQIRIPTHGDKPFSPSDLIQFRSVFNDPLVNNSNPTTQSQSFRFPIDDEAELDLSLRNSPELEMVSLDSLSKYEQKLPRLIPFVYDVNTYQSLSCVLTHIQLLWELILLNEPIAIVGSFPTTCSQTVQALVHIIWPLKYASNYCPFFTIHNSEFHEITFKSSLPKMIIGVTNPFFAKLLHQWPHIIRTDDIQPKKPQYFLLVDREEENLSVNELDDDTDFSSSPSTTPKKTLFTSSKPFQPTDALNSKSSHLTFDMKAGLYTKYKPYLQRDKNILKKLQSTNRHQRPDTVQNAFIRRFFLELTQSFIIPLERYFASLLPLRKYYQASREPPMIREFDKEEFLKTLDQYGPQLTCGLKGDWKELYRHFLSTPNFSLWLSHRRQEGNAKIYSLYLDIISNCHLENDLHISHFTELELIDLAIKFQHLIQRLENPTDEFLLTLDQPFRDDYLTKLRLRMKILLEENLSDDVKFLFNKSIKNSPS